MKKYCLLIPMIVFMLATTVALGNTPLGDQAIILQKDGQLKSLYIAEMETLKPYLLASNEALNVFNQEQNLLYFYDRLLYRYNPLTRESRLLSKFAESEIRVQVLPGSLNQALISAKANYELNWYIIELNDGSLRRVATPKTSGSESNSTIIDTSPDEASQVVLKANPKRRFSLVIQEKIKGRFTHRWSLPQEMTAIPELPVWAPNSRLVAFFAKPFNDQSSYYSLYIFDLDSLKLTKVQDQVFARLFAEAPRMGGFRPDWSADSQSLYFQYQPYGSPTQSVIMSYEVKQAKRRIMVKGPGLNEHPQIAPSGRYLLFISDREGTRPQTYIYDLKRELIQRLAISGETDWAAWYK